MCVYILFKCMCVYILFKVIETTHVVRRYLNESCTPVDE